MRTLKTILMTLVLLAVIGVVGFFTYRFLYPKQGALVAPAASSDSSGTASSSAVPAEPAAADAAVGALCDSVPLAITRDQTFTPVSVTHGDTGDTVGQFMLFNTTPCTISISQVSLLIDTLSSSQIFSSAQLAVDGTPFGQKLTFGTPGTDLAFNESAAPIVVSSFGTVTLSVVADVSAYAPVGQSFILQLTGLGGVNQTTAQPYAWSYTDTLALVESNTFDIQ